MILDRSERPKSIDLFSGAGGLAEGFESVGIAVAAAVELHPQPALTHAFNHPDTAVFAGDIRELDGAHLERRIVDQIGTKKVDLVAGGPPCQGFSTAGKKIANDPRNSLFRQFARIVEQFSPRMFLFENVPGFASMHGGKALAEALKTFAGLGYKTTHRVLNASSYGVPQRRQRFIMVGWRPRVAKPFSWPAETHFSSADRHVLPGFDLDPASVTVEDALDDIAFLKPGFETHRHQRKPKSSFQQERRNGCNFLFNHLATRHREKAQKMFSFIPEGGTISSVPKEYRSAKRTMARWNRKNVSNAVLALPDDLIHYAHDRIPTVREMARLQTFDDDYVFIGKRTSGFLERRVDVPQYTQVGNAVPPLLGRALGFALLDSLGADACDIRNIDERRCRHSWVCGTSGYSGYTLSTEVDESLCLENVYGEKLQLPIFDEDVPVVGAQKLREWVNDPPVRRGQWAPGVKPRGVPAHVRQ